MAASRPTALLLPVRGRRIHLLTRRVQARTGSHRKAMRRRGTKHTCLRRPVLQQDGTRDPGGTILPVQACTLHPGEKHRSRLRSCPRKSTRGSTIRTTWHKRAPAPEGEEQGMGRGAVAMHTGTDTARLTATVEEGAAGAAEAGEHARACQNSQGGALSCLMPVSLLECDVS